MIFHFRRPLKILLLLQTGNKDKYLSPNNAFLKQHHALTTACLLEYAAAATLSKRRHGTKYSNTLSSNTHPLPLGY